MDKKILVNVTAEETRVAVLEDGLLMDIYLERAVRQQLVGSIYKGRVENVLPGMQAAFVNIGLEKNGFLYVEDIPGGKILPLADDEQENGQQAAAVQINIAEVLKRGQDIMVQVVKEPFGTKGPRITSNVTLPGRCLVLMPTVDYIGISRRIEDDEERERLREIAQRIKPQGMGVIIRTVAEGLTEEDFRQDIEFLLHLWRSIQLKTEKGPAPRLLHCDLGLVERTLRDLYSENISKLIVDSEAVYERIVELVEQTAPQLRSRIMLDLEGSLLEKHGVDLDFEHLLNHKVFLKSGGYLIFDHCEAFTAIDVNTGRYVGKTDDLEDTVLQTNLEAVCEIARQVRLRNIGGIIVIDFIDMRDDVHQQLLLQRFEEELKKDKIRSNILGMTRLGLIEITRKKERSPLADLLQVPCPYCSGTGRVLSEDTVSLKIKRQIREFCQYNKAAEILVELHPAVAARLIGSGGQGLRELEQETGRKIFVHGEDTRRITDFDIKPQHSELQPVRTSN